MELNKAQRTLANIIEEAWKSPSFKERLLKEPKQAIEQFTGNPLHIPQGKKLVVLDQTDQNTIFINIPPEPNFDDFELNEAQLEHIAGGGKPNDPILVDPNAGAYHIF